MAIQQQNRDPNGRLDVQETLKESVNSSVLKDPASIKNLAAKPSVASKADFLLSHEHVQPKEIDTRSGLLKGTVTSSDGLQNYTVAVTPHRGK